MSESSIYSLSFSLNALHHLGIGLYSNVPAVLSEMVANSWDAGSTRVNVTLGRDQIEIEDNGRGMSLREINQRFLRIAYEKRREETEVMVGSEKRHVMGRKGIGKLSAFSIANTIEVRTVKDGEFHGFMMSLPDIEEAIRQEAQGYYPSPIGTSHHSPESGTVIRLRDIRQPLTGLEAALRVDLARRFSVIDDNRQFTVCINGVPITLKDRHYYDKIQFMWYFGEESEKYTERCINLKKSVPLNNEVDRLAQYYVRGWIATVAKPKDIPDQHHAVSIFAHGKLIQENILDDIQDARVFMTYLIGEVDADFMDADNDADIVTSDRQRINQQDPRYGQLREFIAREVRRIGNTWDDFRKIHVPNTRKKSLKEQDSAEADVRVNSGDSVEPSVNIDIAGIDTGLPQGDLALTQGANATTAQPGLGSEVPGDTARVEPGTVGTTPRPSPNLVIGNIRAALESSGLEQKFKDVILADLEQARRCYIGEAYKACIVMLGAVLEGIMLGTLRRPDVMDRLLNDSELWKVLGIKGGARNPAFQDRAVLAQKLADDLAFEDYRHVIEKAIPTVRELKPVSIQQYRNTVHPWLSVKQPATYQAMTFELAMMYCTNLAAIAADILRWDPSVF